MREIEVLSFGTIDELAERLPNRSQYFLLMLAWDALDKTPRQLMSFFRPLVDRGLVYFCAWGNNSEAVHDAVDQCDIQKHQEAGAAILSDSIVMTTWHARDSLREALWFFKLCAIPNESIVPADCDRFAVAVGNSEWAAEMEKALQSIEGDADDEVEPLESNEDQ